MATANTHLFAHSSLSQSLLSGLLIALSAIFAFVKGVTCASPKCLPTSSWFVVTWALYILLHSVFVPSESYRMYYYITGLLLCLSTSILLKSNLLKWRLVEDVWLCLGSKNQNTVDDSFRIQERSFKVHQISLKVF